MLENREENPEASGENGARNQEPGTRTEFFLLILDF